MTTIQTSRPVTRETSATSRGRPLIVELHAGYMTLREKGRRTRVMLDYRAAHDLAWKIHAREATAQKRARKRSRC